MTWQTPKDRTKITSRSHAKKKIFVVSLLLAFLRVLSTSLMPGWQCWTCFLIPLLLTYLSHIMAFPKLEDLQVEEWNQENKWKCAQIADKSYRVPKGSQKLFSMQFFFSKEMCASEPGKDKLFSSSKLKKKIPESFFLPHAVQIAITWCQEDGTSTGEAKES